MEHDTRDLDGVIDKVAQAMTGAELRRDLRPAIAARIAGGPSWTLGWRMGTAMAVVASIVLVMVVMQPGREPETAAPAPVAAVQQTPRALPPRPDLKGPLPLRVRRASVGRQRLGDTTTADVVEIDPLAIVPLDAHEASVAQRVEIAPIAVAPVVINQLEAIAE